jgi:hypothetical protein
MRFVSARGVATSQMESTLEHQTSVVTIAAFRTRNKQSAEYLFYERERSDTATRKKLKEDG